MGLKAKATYCQDKVIFSAEYAEGAEENRKQGEDKGAKYVSLASLAP